MGLLIKWGRVKFGVCFYIFDAYFDIGLPLAAPLAALEDVEHFLVPFGWLDSNTHYLEMQAAFFNAEVY